MQKVLKIRRSMIRENILDYLTMIWIRTSGKERHLEEKDFWLTGRVDDQPTGIDHVEGFNPPSEELFIVNRSKL